VDKSLVTTNQNAKVALSKSKSLLKITDGILANRDDKWLDFILEWADKNIIQENTNFPKNKEELSKAKHIILRWNRLKLLPKEFFRLIQLEILELNNNALEVLPNEIGNLKKLKQLNLNINSLKTLPKEIINLKRLEVINIKNNKYLELDSEQISWLIELKNNGCNVIYDKYKFNLGE
jgi:Leucine-rich repeat (LRR) protein